MNKLRRSKLVGTRYEKILEFEDSENFTYFLKNRRNCQMNIDDALDSLSGSYPNGKGSSYNNSYNDFLQNDFLNEYSVNCMQEVPDELKDLLQFFNNTDPNDIQVFTEFITPTKQELDHLGHLPEDFFLQCSFDRRPCNGSEFYKFHNTAYGNCYTFNKGVPGGSLLTTTKTGTKYGLKLTLFIDEAEYIGLFSPEVGVKVSVNPSNIMPVPEDDGFALRPGTSSFIGLRQTSVERLKPPYGTCSNETEHTLWNYMYSKRSCLYICYQKKLLAYCGCVTDVEWEEPQCNALKATDRVCIEDVDTKFVYGFFRCASECPTPCTETIYRKTISSAVWPSEQFQVHLRGLLGGGNENISKVLDDLTLTRTNLVRLNVFMEDLNFERIWQSPLYTFEDLLGAVGGLMGLYVGASVITLCELAVLIVGITKTVLRRNDNSPDLQENN